LSNFLGRAWCDSLLAIKLLEGYAFSFGHTI
jgi:hypothetical protein